MRILVLVACAACSAPSQSTPLERAPAQPVAAAPRIQLDREALDAWVDRELAPNLPAVAVGIVVDDELLWYRGAGSRDGRGGPAPGRDSMFRIGSITKVLTATAVMQLRDAGVLDIDAPVADWVPELKPRLESPEGKPITLRNLMTHTSGIPTLGNGAIHYWEQRSVAEAQDELLSALDVPLEFEPGSRSSYSNAGMALAGLVVARASKRPYRDYMAEEVLEPLGMKAIWDVSAVGDGVRVAGLGMNGAIDPPTWMLGAFEAAGGLWASLDDMVGLARFVFGRPGTDKVLAPASRQSMLTDDPLPGNHGMAWIVGDGIVGHTGSTTDFAATIFAYPEKGVAAIVLAAGGKWALTDCAGGALARAAVEGGAPASCAQAAPAK